MLLTVRYKNYTPKSMKGKFPKIHTTLLWHGISSSYKTTMTLEIILVFFQYEGLYRKMGCIRILILKNFNVFFIIL